jgi:hypothetical protein
MKVGDRVINIHKSWHSGFKKHKGCVRGSICGGSGQYCCDYTCWIGPDKGIKGTIMQITETESSYTGILVHWDDGTFCGKTNTSIELDICQIRENKLNELVI